MIASSSGGSIWDRSAAKRNIRWRASEIPIAYWRWDLVSWTQGKYVHTDIKRLSWQPAVANRFISAWAYFAQGSRKRDPHRPSNAIGISETRLTKVSKKQGRTVIVRVISSRFDGMILLG